MNPWRELADDPSITVVFADLPGDLLGFCDHETRTIWIRKGMRQRQRNATLQHERLHLQRGIVFKHWQVAEERAVEEATARALIPLDALCCALRWSRDVHDIADELHVPVSLVQVRAKSMRHPAERAAVAAVMADLALMDAV